MVKTGRASKCDVLRMRLLPAKNCMFKRKREKELLFFAKIHI